MYHSEKSFFKREPYPIEITQLIAAHLDMFTNVDSLMNVARLAHNHPKTLALPQASLRASAYRSSMTPLPTGACYPLETYWCALQ